MTDKEEYAIILDFLPNGLPLDNRPAHRKTALAQAMGKSRFTLLELVPKKDVFLAPNEEVYIGEGKRDKVHHINGRIGIDQLTNTARAELQFLVTENIKANENRYVEFFNKAQPLSTRMHTLELLPGLGKKHMWEVLQARDDRDFESFQDIRDRVKLMPDPEKLVLRRIMLELEGKEKHKLFVD
jgi:putative nucleotide binding protein